VKRQKEESCMMERCESATMRLKRGDETHFEAVVTANSFPLVTSTKHRIFTFSDV